MYGCVMDKRMWSRREVKVVNGGKVERGCLSSECLDLLTYYL